MALELWDGRLVNLNIGVPTGVTHQIAAGMNVFFRSENALFGMGAPPPEGLDDRRLTDAGGVSITAFPGAWSFEG